LESISYVPALLDLAQQKKVHKWCTSFMFQLSMEMTDPWHH
jgi:hypothetical protein